MYNAAVLGKLLQALQMVLVFTLHSIYMLSALLARTPRYDVAHHLEFNQDFAQNLPVLTLLAIPLQRLMSLKPGAVRKSTYVGDVIAMQEQQAQDHLPAPASETMRLKARFWLHPSIAMACTSCTMQAAFPALLSVQCSWKGTKIGSIECHDRSLYAQKQPKAVPSYDASRM